MLMQSFKCEHCRADVGNLAIGTRHRNHCPYCLWSKHLDQRIPGDRASACRGLMEPMGITFKNKGGDQGELMVVHKCLKCGQIEKNRVAGDDDAVAIEALYQTGLRLEKSVFSKIESSGIKLAGVGDEREVVTQLYGRPEAVKRFDEK